MPQREIVNQAEYPWQTIVYIESTFSDGWVVAGSGVMVGPNDVLTAAHLVYEIAHGGAAIHITVTPTFDPSPLEAPFGTVKAVSWHYFSDFDPDGDGRWLGGNRGPGYSGSEHDVALLDLNVALGNDTGWMSLDPNFRSGYVNLTGYPDHYGRNMMNDYGYVQQNAVDAFIDITNLEAWPGNSGGPLWYRDGNGTPHVVGLMSTVSPVRNGVGFAAYDVSAEYDIVLGWIASNDSLIAIA
jgi:V8-like Glu-specific endopeptidase